MKILSRLAFSAALVLFGLAVYVILNSIISYAEQKTTVNAEIDRETSRINTTSPAALTRSLKHFVSQLTAHRNMAVWFMAKFFLFLLCLVTGCLAWIISLQIQLRRLTDGREVSEDNLDRHGTENRIPASE